MKKKRERNCSKVSTRQGKGEEMPLPEVEEGRTGYVLKEILSGAD